MRIQKIEIAGFKSFKDRTVIQFDAGITGIVGPNGCGKSNIVDSLVWVMGEMSAKDLRGSQMTDVIFAGTETYGPLGVAEVSLTLLNDGGPFPVKYQRMSEIMVTRRLYRNGESEYLINKEPARLKDIQEIFMDTGAGAKGFSIIQQGMIGRIVTSKPEDRRHLIEEAAGLTKFKARKKESQRKLDQTEQNLMRMADIISEVEKQVDSLARQAEKAQKYRDMKSRIESLDMRLAVEEFGKYETEIATLKSSGQSAGDLERDLESQRSLIESKLAGFRTAQLEREKNLEDAAQELKLREDRLRTKQFEIDRLSLSAEQMGRDLERIDSTKAEQLVKQEGFSARMNELETQITESSEGLSQVRTRFVEADSEYKTMAEVAKTKDSELTSQRRELFAILQSTGTLEARASSFEANYQDIQTRIEEAQYELNEKNEKLTDAKTEAEALKSTVDEANERFLAAGQQLGELRVANKILQEDLHKKEIEHNKLVRSRDETQSHLAALEKLRESRAGFSEGAREVLSHFADAKPLLEYLQADKYEAALEQALGIYHDLLLIQGEESIVQAFQSLREHEKGRVQMALVGGPKLGRTLPSADLIPTLRAKEGVLALGQDFYSQENPASAWLQELLGSLVIVQNLEIALSLSKEFSGWDFITEQGEMISSQGVYWGGQAGDGPVLRTLKEIQTLTQQLESTQAQVDENLVKVEALRTQIAESKTQEENLVSERQQLQIQAVEMKKDYELANSGVQQLERDVARAQMELLKLNGREEEVRDKLEEIREKLLEQTSRKSELESAISEIDQDLESDRQRLNPLQEEVQELRIQLVSLEQQLKSQEREREMIESSLRDLSTGGARLTDEFRLLMEQKHREEKQAEVLKAEVDFLIQGIEEAREKVIELREILDKAHQEVREDEDKLLKLAQELSRLQTNRGELSIRCEQLELKLQFRRNQLTERYILTQEEMERKVQLLRENLQAQEESSGEKTPAVDIEKTGREIHELQEKVARMGEVNLTAIEEYNVVNERFQYLTRQRDDLEKAKSQLIEVMERIDSICAQRFKDTFEAVREKFQKVFPVLFGGGVGRIELVQEEGVAPEDAGIEIIAQPPGKRMQSVSLMSGGEKALTAVALVFSIFLIRPSPYCLLDEVDAPLDDANVHRFNELVREMSRRSQVILITHNKNTMSGIGKLYGVTMQERGVSTMVSVDLGSQRFQKQAVLPELQNN